MTDTSGYAEHLRKVPLFNQFSEREIDSITRSLKERTYEPGAVIVKEGDPGMGFFLIADGRVQVTHEGHPIRDLGPGDYFGEMALMEERARTATVTAAERTRCLQLVRWDFRALLREHPDMAVKLLETIVRRLREHSTTHVHD